MSLGSSLFDPLSLENNYPKNTYIFKSQAGDIGHRLGCYLAVCRAAVDVIVWVRDKMKQQFSSTVTAASGKFVRQLGHDLVRMAVGQEGLERWLVEHGGSITLPGAATRRLAADMYGDAEEAALINAAMTFEIDKHGAHLKAR